MKTIEQILELTKNPYYELQPDEQAVLDDFLSKKRVEDSKKSQKKNSKKSDKQTNVHVRNLVPKMIPHVEYAPEDTDAS